MPADHHIFLEAHFFICVSLYLSMRNCISFPEDINELSVNQEMLVGHKKIPLRQFSKLDANHRAKILHLWKYKSRFADLHSSPPTFVCQNSMSARTKQ